MSKQMLFNMTLRDYFAGQALTGLTIFHLQNGTVFTGEDDWARENSRSAYALADAMMKERRVAGEIAMLAALKAVDEWETTHVGDAGPFPIEQVREAISKAEGTT